MSIESSLGLRNYLSTAAITSDRGVLIDTTTYAWGTSKEILIEREPFKDYRIAHRLLSFRKWMYLGTTFLTMIAGTTVASSMFVPHNESGESAPAYIYFLGGLAIRIGINSLIESMKANSQLNSIGG
jgi:hypothetical protein